MPQKEEEENPLDVLARVRAKRTEDEDPMAVLARVRAARQQGVVAPPGITPPAKETLVPAPGVAPRAGAFVAQQPEISPAVPPPPMPSMTAPGGKPAEYKPNVVDAGLVAFTEALTPGFLKGKQTPTLHRGPGGRIPGGRFPTEEDVQRTLDELGPEALARVLN